MRRLNVDILYEGVAVGRGTIRSIDPTRAFVTIRDFPLGADSFLELSIHVADGRSRSIPVRVIDNTGEGLEVGIEGIEPTAVTDLLSG